MKDSASGCYSALEEAVITGGGPMLNRHYLVDLVSQLKEFVRWIVLDTNGFLLDAAYLEELIAAGLTAVIFDLKAWDEKLHERYTGYSNKYMKNSVIGKSGVRERKIELKRSWITVFPDGTLKRRTLDDYRTQIVGRK